MAIKTFSMDYKNLISDKFLRIDEKYHSFYNTLGWDIFQCNSQNTIPLKSILSEDCVPFDFEDGILYNGIPTGQSYIDEDGDIIDYQPITSEDHPNRLKYRIKNDNLLISSIRLAKSPALLYETIDTSKYVFSNGFYILKVNPDWNKKFILYILRSKRVKKLLDYNIYRGIGISSYKLDDLLKIRIPVIIKGSQDAAVDKIMPIESQIRSLKANRKPIRKIIDEVLERDLKLNITEALAVGSTTEFFMWFGVLSNHNSNLRFSYRWNKLEQIQTVLLRDVLCVKKLGKFIYSTKNGWSPTCTENASTYSVLGIDAINKEGVLTFDNPKFTDETKNNIEDFIIKAGEFFVSRGNTTDLVALASIAPKELADEYIYPDLMIKIDFDQEIINKEYLAYIINSIVGRLYFKFAAKGKNQTMVKISSTEINDFLLPVPDMKLQQRIVAEIKDEIDKQNIVNDEISRLRDEIDKIVEAVIMQ